MKLSLLISLILLTPSLCWSQTVYGPSESLEHAIELADQEKYEKLLEFFHPEWHVAYLKSSEERKIKGIYRVKSKMIPRMRSAHKNINNAKLHYGTIRGKESVLMEFLDDSNQSVVLALHKVDDRFVYGGLIGNSEFTQVMNFLFIPKGEMSHDEAFNEFLSLLSLEDAILGRETIPRILGSMDGPPQKDMELMLQKYIESPKKQKGLNIYSQIYDHSIRANTSQSSIERKPFFSNSHKRIYDCKLI